MAWKLLSYRIFFFFAVILVKTIMNDMSQGKQFHNLIFIPGTIRVIKSQATARKRATKNNGKFHGSWKTREKTLRRNSNVFRKDNYGHMNRNSLIQDTL
jgi:hypothetical protein